MKLFQKYTHFIPLQIGILAIFLIYIISLGVSIVLFSNSLFPPIENPERNTVTIHLFIESNHPDNMFNYSYVNNVTKNITLIEHLNNTIGSANWEGRYYTPGGWFVTGIFNASEDTNWSWIIYYHLPTSTSWIYAPVGASSIRLEQDYYIKFSYESRWSDRE